MPIRIDDIEKYGAPITFLEKGKVQVRNGPNLATFLKEDIIPLDGRFYCCAGTIILRNGITLRANFEINTHTFDFLERDTVRVYIDKERAWYSLDEQGLFEIFEIKKEDALPYKWLPDKPLNYYKQGPYAMNFYTDE